jgi:hypothetical protein
MKRSSLPAMAVVILALGGLELFQFHLLQPLENRLLDRFVRSQAARLLGAAPLVADARLQRYLNNVGRWLASQTERAELPACCRTRSRTC